MRFRILFQGPGFVAIDKPAGFHVHPPEDERFRISRRENALAILRDQLGTYVYPVHRLDRATSGVVLYGLSPAAASRLAPLFADRQVRKTYYAVVRGMPPATGRFDSPLAEEGKAPVPAATAFRSVAAVELPWPNARFPTSRYALVRITPETGRYHQIRKHFRRAGHPLIGDTVHGEGLHNRYWRSALGGPQLLLRASALEFREPFGGETVAIRAPWRREWLRVFDAFEVCPHEPAFPDPDAPDSGSVPFRVKSAFNTS